MISVSHHEPGDWQLVVKVNGKKLYDGIVGEKTVKEGWLDLELDLSEFSGRTARIEIEHRGNDWNNEFGYWQRLEVALPPAAP
ncbi:MAG: hypothetical protein HYS13_01475 [Planctomycetia bacterium]|nr:hypothetical protein [Planctomycetia bacterium]